MTITLNSALTGNSRGTYNPSMINFGKNELKNTTYLKEAPRTEVKHASKFARTAAKFMLGAMGLLSMNACSGSDDIPDVPKTADTSVWAELTKGTNEVGLSNATGDQKVGAYAYQTVQDGKPYIISMDYNSQSANKDTVYATEKATGNEDLPVKIYRKSNSAGLFESSSDGVADLTFKNGTMIETNNESIKKLAKTAKKDILHLTETSLNGESWIDTTVKVIKSEVKYVK